MKTTQTFRTALMVAALAAAGGVYAAGTTTSDSTMPPANNASSMPSRSDGDKEKLPAASTGAKADASVDNAKQSVTDSALTTKIKTKLLATKDLKSTGIHVKTKDRVVNLTGSVTSQDQRQLALDTVRSVEGVDTVSDNLKVSSR